MSDKKKIKHSLSFYRVLPITKIILSILLEVGEITVKSFFPPQYAKKYGYSFLFKNQHRYQKTYKNSVHYLKRKGLIENKGNGIYCLTSEGEKEAFFAHLNTESKFYQTKSIKWDGKWRIIFFDVPEKKRHYRDYLRTILKTIGFKEFQKSIWIYPYPVPKFLKDLLFEEGIKQYTRFITTYDIEYDKDMKKMFKI